MTCDRYRMRREDWWTCKACCLSWCERNMGDRWRPYACPDRDQRQEEPIEPVSPIGLIDA